MLRVYFIIKVVQLDKLKSSSLLEKLISLCIIVIITVYSSMFLQNFTKLNFV